MPSKLVRFLASSQRAASTKYTAVQPCLPRSTFAVAPVFPAAHGSTLSASFAYALLALSEDPMTQLPCSIPREFSFFISIRGSCRSQFRSMSMRTLNLINH